MFFPQKNRKALWNVELEHAHKVLMIGLTILQSSPTSIFGEGDDDTSAAPFLPFLERGGWEEEKTKDSSDCRCSAPNAKRLRLNTRDAHRFLFFLFLEGPFLPNS